MNFIASQLGKYELKKISPCLIFGIIYFDQKCKKMKQLQLNIFLHLESTARVTSSKNCQVVDFSLSFQAIFEIES
jgi:hypothetical protein